MPKRRLKFLGTSINPGICKCIVSKLKGYVDLFTSVIKQKMRSNPAYTLSEVLITIGIVGIITFLMIPNFIHKKTDKELVSRFLKANTVLSNAYKDAIVIDGIHKMKADDFKQTFKNHLKSFECEEHDVCRFYV